MKWKLNRIQYPVYNLGYGKRIALWVQGCSLKCKGCISKELQDTSGGKLVDVEQLADQIIRIHKSFEGITITGGEPFEQYLQLVAFCAYVKEHTNLNIHVFSGYRFDELIKKHPDKLFMRFTDFLTDGRYIRELHCNDTTKGSNNQQHYVFIDNKAILKDQGFESGYVGVYTDTEGQIYLSGIPKKDEMKSLSAFLKESGFKIEF